MAILDVEADTTELTGTPRAIVGGSDTARAILAAIVAGPIAFSGAAELADRAALTPRQVADDLADLDAEGWVATWETPGVGILVTLTPLAARRLDVRLIELGIDETPRWADPFTPEPDGPKALDLFRDPADLAAVHDPSQADRRAAERREAAELARPAAGRGGDDTTPLLGLQDQWFGPFALSGRDCPSCSGPHARGFCTYCDRTARPRPSRSEKARRVAAARPARRRLGA